MFILDHHLEYTIGILWNIYFLLYFRVRLYKMSKKVSRTFEEKQMNLLRHDGSHVSFFLVLFACMSRCWHDGIVFIFSPFEHHIQSPMWWIQPKHVACPFISKKIYKYTAQLFTPKFNIRIWSIEIGLCIVLGAWCLCTVLHSPSMNLYFKHWALKCAHPYINLFTQIAKEISVFFDFMIYV